MKILLCPDRPNWAFDNIAKNIQKYELNADFSVMYMAEYDKPELDIIKYIVLNNIDVCHVFWREDLFYLLRSNILAKSANYLNLEQRTLAGALSSCAFTTSVYDHLFLDEGDLKAREIAFAAIDGYTVSSPKLLAAYENKACVAPPDALITDGVNIPTFSPSTHPPRQKDVPTVGWVGNSAWGQNALGRDVKGYLRLFLPAIERLANQGVRIQTRMADPQINLIAHNQMPDFYRSLDVFVCSSEMEGTPNTVLEAMSCGIPIISTDVGIVADAFGPLQSRFILRENSVEELSKALRTLLEDVELRTQLANENRAQIGQWCWSKKSLEWLPFWRAAAKRTTDSTSANRRRLLLLTNQPANAGA